MHKDDNKTIIIFANFAISEIGQQTQLITLNT